LVGEVELAIRAEGESEGVAYAGGVDLEEVGLQDLGGGEVGAGFGECEWELFVGFEIEAEHGAADVCVGLGLGFVGLAGVGHGADGDVEPVVADGEAEGDVVGDVSWETGDEVASMVGIAVFAGRAIECGDRAGVEVGEVAGAQEVAFVEAGVAVGDVEGAIGVDGEAADETALGIGVGLAVRTMVWCFGDGGDRLDEFELVSRTPLVDLDQAAEVADVDVIVPRGDPCRVVRELHC